MKTKSILLLTGLLVCATIIVNAQNPGESQVKVIKTDKPGVIKMIHAIATDEPVVVRFSNDQGIIVEDKIKGTFAKGISRRYNMNRFFDKNFRIEIKSETIDVTYQIVPSKDKQTFTAYLEKVEHHHQLLATR
jgi:hypothetical protein